MAGNPRIDELRKKVDKDPGSRLFAQLAEELRAEYVAWVRERSPEVAEWIEQVERDGDWQPDAAKAWKGTI